MSLLESLQRGWYGGWAEFPELVAGGAGLLESLIPGEQESLTTAEDYWNKAAENVRSKGGTGQSQGLLEKIAEGVGAAPGTLASMAPFLMGSAAALPAGATIAAPALGFGAYNLVRSGDEGLAKSVGHGLKGAAEGALFGGVGRWASSLGVNPAAAKLLDKRRSLISEGVVKGTPRAAELEALNKEIASITDTLGGKALRKVAHGAGAGGIVGGMTAIHGGSAEDAIAAGSTMGLLGMLSSGKFKEPVNTAEASLRSLRPEAVEWAAKQARKVKEKDGLVEYRHYTDPERLPDGIPTRPDSHGSIWMTEGQAYLEGPHVKIFLPKDRILDFNDPATFPKYKDRLPRGMSKTDLINLAREEGYIGYKAGRDVAVLPEYIKEAKSKGRTSIDNTPLPPEITPENTGIIPETFEAGVERVKKAQEPPSRKEILRRIRDKDDDEFLYHGTLSEDIARSIDEYGLTAGGLADLASNALEYAQDPTGFVSVFRKSDIPRLKPGSLNDVGLAEGWTPVKPVATFRAADLEVLGIKPSEGARWQELGGEFDPPGIRLQEARSLASEGLDVLLESRAAKMEPVMPLDLDAAYDRSRPYSMLTPASRQRFVPIEKDLRSIEKKENYDPRTNEDVMTRTTTAVLTDENGRFYGNVSDADAVYTAIRLRSRDYSKRMTELMQRKELEKQEGRLGEVALINEEISRIKNLYMSDLSAARGFESPAASILRMTGVLDKTDPQWQAAVKRGEKMGMFEKNGTGQFRADIEELLQLSEGNPLLQAKIVKAINTPTLFDKIQEYWINGLLSGLPTHMVNGSSNSLIAGIDLAERRAATSYEARFGREYETIRGPERLSREQAALENATDLRSSIMGLPKVFKAFAQVMRSGEDIPLTGEFAKYQELLYGQSKVDYHSRAIGGKLGQAIRMPSKALQAMDLGFKIHAADRYGTLKAMRMAWEDANLAKLPKGRERIGNTRAEIAKRTEEYLGNVPGKEPHADVLSAMKKNAERLTYTKPPSYGLQKALMVRDIEVDVPVLGKIRPLVGVVPFVNTPWNVIVEAVKRSPLGILRLKKLKADYEAGRIQPHEYYKEIASTAMGTTATVSMIALAKAGLITGGGPVNQQDRQNKLVPGWRPYSVKIPGVGYFQMQRIEPLGTILGMAADIAEYGDADDKTGKLLAIVKDNLTDKSFLYGLEAIAAAWANPEMRGATYYKQMTGSAVPTLLAKTAQAFDPYTRVTEATGADVGVPDAMAYRIPGLSTALPARTTPLGKPVERWGVLGTGSPAANIVSGIQSFTVPVPLSAERPDTVVEREFDRLSKYEGIPPAMPNRNKTMTLQGVGGQKVKLTNDEYAIYDRYHAMAKQQLERVVSSSAYQALNSPDQQAKLLRSIYDRFRRAANNEINMSIRRRTTVGE